jgi:hypothetical protein
MSLKLALPRNQEELCVSLIKQEVLGRANRKESDAFNNSSTAVCLFFTEVTFLPSYCLATTGEIHFTEQLPSNDRRDTLYRAVA